MIARFIFSPLLPLVCLSALSLLFRRAFMPPGPSPTAAGAIVMAIGIFAISALQQMPVGDLGTVTGLAALELLVIWAVIAASYLQSWLGGTMHRRTMDPVDRFAVGTWVAGTSVLGQTILLALPAWRPVVWALGLVAALLWLWFLILALPGFQTIAIDPTREHAKGRILLSTVATQSVLILAVDLFSARIPHSVAAAVIALGGLFYVAGIVLIAARYLGQRHARLADDWDNTNCIIHGAGSITGLAAVISGALPLNWIIAIWLWVLLMFLAVESVELARAQRRVRDYGWRRGLFTYNVSQWARNFTFGMFYAFTLHLLLRASPSSVPADLHVALTAIVSYGQYVVLALLVAEAALFFQAKIRLPGRAAAVSQPA